MLYHLSRLDGESIKALQDFEAQTGRTVLAMSRLEVSSDELENDELARLQALERDLDVVLVAVKERPTRARRRRGG